MAVCFLDSAKPPFSLWQTCDYALRKMITTDNTGQKEIHSSPVLLLRKENLLR